MKRYIRHFIAASAILFPAMSFAQTWTDAFGVEFIEGSIVGVKRWGPADPEPGHRGEVPFYLNTTPGAGYTVPYSNNEWGWFDWSPYVPPGTKAVFLGGILSVIGGFTLDGCNLTVTLSAGDSVRNEPYILQALVGPSNVDGGGVGVRLPVGVWVPLDSQRLMRFKVRWWTNSGDESLYPLNCAYFVSLRAEAYVR